MSRPLSTHLVFPWVLTAVGTVGFFGLAGLVGRGVQMPFDPAILLALREPANLADPLGGPVIEGYVRDFTALGGAVVLTLLTGLVILYLLLAQKTRTALVVFGAVASGELLKQALKLVVDRPRPEIVPHLMTEASLSFPSGHAMMSTVAYLTFASVLARFEPLRSLRIFFYTSAVLLAAGVGLSQLYMGVHWPSDVLAGWCAGLAWAMIWLIIGDRMLKR